jgi:hypothetical protein
MWAATMLASKPRPCCCRVPTDVCAQRHYLHDCVLSFCLSYIHLRTPIPRLAIGWTDINFTTLINSLLLNLIPCLSEYTEKCPTNLRGYRRQKCTELSFEILSNIIFKDFFSFSKCPDLLWGPSSPHFKRHRVPFPGIRRPWCDVDLQPHLASKLRMRETIDVLLPQAGQEKLHLSFPLYKC